ncbi:hypothetical protein HYU13_04085 [Candidatus Woesearchaeota archaeon]|nr:hypothetical protein [Candidatus Woesearchaeota archaeon]
MPEKEFVRITFEELETAFKKGFGNHALKVDSEKPARFGLFRGNPALIPLGIETRDLELYVDMSTKLFINFSLELPYEGMGEHGYIKAKYPDTRILTARGHDGGHIRVPVFPKYAKGFERNHGIYVPFLPSAGDNSPKGDFYILGDIKRP